MEDKKNIRVILIPKYMSDEELERANIRPEATVEAEYGDNVIKGKIITLAHHIEEYKENPAPCNTENIPILQNDSTIVVSHLDLDTLGGIAALMGRKKEDKAFWSAVEFIDLNGVHNLYQLDKETSKKYNAYRAYQETHRMQRINDPTDVTDIALKYLDVVDLAIDGDKALLEKGEEWYQESQKQIEECLIGENRNLRIFKSPNGIFCSAAYYSEKQGKVIPCTVSLNGKTGAITVAMEDGGKDFSAKELVQKLWGNEAGGHPGIAGSPRGKEMTEKDLQEVSQFINEIYNRKRGTNEMLELKIAEHSLLDIKEAVADRNIEDLKSTVAEISREMQKSEMQEKNRE